MILKHIVPVQPAIKPLHHRPSSIQPRKLHAIPRHRQEHTLIITDVYFVDLAIKRITQAFLLAIIAFIAHSMLFPGIVHVIYISPIIINNICVFVLLGNLTVFPAITDVYNRNDPGSL